MSFITFNEITVRVKDKFLFEKTSLQLEKTDNLLVVGPNGSGKTTFVKAIAGLLPVSQGEIILEFLKDPLPYPSVHKDKIAYISFDGHKKIHQENEFKKDLSEFTGKKVKILNLSTGQIRKYLIDKALEKNPAILILDEPFDGLDIVARNQFKRIIEELSEELFVILVTHKSNEIVKGFKKAILIKEGKIEKYGDTLAILKSFRLLSDTPIKVVKKVAPESGSLLRGNKILIDFRDVSVEFGGKKILQNINWQVKAGENWAILGPNGAGKSTLIKLITGENLQVFGNKIKIFEKTRNEMDIDKVNKYIGLVSADLSLRIHDYLQVDKIIGPKNFWIIQKFGLTDLMTKKYGELSFGQKRLVLIAKALCKKPEILILDEPCHGLDTTNRLKVLNEIELIARNGTTIILITHHDDEIIPSINRVMYLRDGKISRACDFV